MIKIFISGFSSAFGGKDLKMNVRADYFIFTEKDTEQKMVSIVIDMSQTPAQINEGIAQAVREDAASHGYTVEKDNIFFQPFAGF